MTYVLSAKIERVGESSVACLPSTLKMTKAVINENTTSTRLKEGYFARIRIDGVIDEGQKGTGFEDKEEEEEGGRQQ